MTAQSEFITLSGEVATKRARLQALFAGAEDLSGNAASERASAIKSANQELSKLVDRLTNLHGQVTAEQLEADALKAMRRPVGRQVLPDNLDFGPGSSTTPRAAGPSWGEAVIKANDEQGGMSGLKSLLPSGTAVVEVPIGGPIEIPRRAKFLAEIIPFEDAPGGHFAYLRQTVRTNNAGVVAEGGLKPTSVYSLEEIEDATDVIAHLSESLPRTYFDDSPKIRQFIDAEMKLGVNLATDAKIVTDLLATVGILVEGDIGTTLDTTRRCITRLQEREVEPTAWILHPRDWEQLELEMTAGYAANSNIPAPTDEVRRSLFGYPVVVSNALPENTGLLGDFGGSAALYRTGGVRLDWNESGDDFAHNLIRFRAETRAALAVYRPFAFVSINLAGTGS